MALKLVSSNDLGKRLPAPDEVQSAKELLAIMEPFSRNAAPAKVSVAAGGKSRNFHLSPAVARTLVHVLQHFAAGNAVALLPVGAVLTTQQAADALNVSRPYLIKILEAGEVSFEKVGRHRRIPAAELFAYKQKRDETRREALAEMAALDSEEGEV